MTKKQSLSGYVLENLESIEQQMEMGVYQEAICSDLKAAGFDVTLPSFRQAVFRARQKRGGAVKSVVDKSVHPLPGVRLQPHELNQIDSLQRSNATLSGPLSGGAPKGILVSANDLQALRALLDKILLQSQ